MVIFVSAVLIVVVGLIIALCARLCSREKEVEDVTKNTDLNVL